MSTTNRATDRDDRGRLKRCLRGPNLVQSTPRYWVQLYMTRPRRRENRRLCLQVVRGRGPDAIAWPLGSRRPHVYYW